MAEKFLPREEIHRRKIGLWLPYHEWFQDPKGAGLYLDALTAPDSRLRQFSEGHHLTAFVENFRRDANRHAGLILQRLVELELWMRSVPPQATL